MLTPWGAYIANLTPGVRPFLLDRTYGGWLIRLVLTGLGCLAGAGLLARGICLFSSTLLFSPLVLFCLAQVPFILIAPVLWDRYLLVFFPGAIFLAVKEVSENPRVEGFSWRSLPALAALVALGLASIGLMHDWQEWNRARWELGRRALAREINPRDIEGGFEWDGWYKPDDIPKERSWTKLFDEFGDRRAPPKGLTLIPTRTWFPHVTGRYALSFSSEVKDTEIEDSEPYRPWLTPGERHFYLLRDTLDPSKSPGAMKSAK
jgi:hypothetical protein